MNQESRTPADRTLDPLENIDEPEVVELPPFQEGEVECPKCKFMGVPSTTYHDASPDPLRTARQRRNAMETGVYPEHMSRACGCCGYSWREALPV